MTKRLLVIVGISLLFFPLLSGCEKSGKGEPEGRELVKVNDIPISFEEFRQMSERQSLEGKMRLLNEKGARDFLDNYVVPRGPLSEAVKKGLDKTRDGEKGKTSKGHGHRCPSKRC
jgi:hypothetical protein